MIGLTVTILKPSRLYSCDPSSADNEGFYEKALLPLALSDFAVKSFKTSPTFQWASAGK